MPTLAEIDEELERRELIASIEGGRTATEQIPAGASAAAGAQANLEGIPENLGNTPEMGAAILRGIPGASQLGTGIAAAAASFGSGQSIGDTYSDMREADEMEAAAFEEAAPALSDFAGGLGTAAAAIPLGAVGAARGLSGALAAKGAAALGKVGSKVTGLRGARAAAEAPAAGKRYRGGKIMGDVEAPPPPRGRLKGTMDAAAIGAVLDDDAVEGAGTGAALFNLLFNSPMGRAFNLAMGRKMGGSKLTQAAWHGMNPQNKKQVKDLFKTFLKSKGAK